MKTLSKIAAIAISAALAACAFGCGSSNTAASNDNPGFEPQSIEINDPGYVVTDDGMLRYAFIAVNPNDGYVAENVIFTIEAYDANGSMIAGGGDSVPALYPGVETAGAGETELFSRSTETPQVASLSIVAMMDSITWTETTLTNTEIEDSIEIVKPRMDGTQGGDTNITATIAPAQDDKMKLDASKPIELRAVALMFNENGNAICGTSPVTFTLDPDASYSFKATISDTPAYAKSVLYVTPNAIL